MPLDSARQSKNHMLKLSDIGWQDQVLIAAFRRWVVGWTCNDVRHWNRVRRDLRDELGHDPSETAVTAVAGLVANLGRAGQMPVRSHPPCCTFLSPTEVQLAELFTACRRGDRIRARQIARHMVADAEGAELLIWATRLVSAAAPCCDLAHAIEAQAIESQAIEAI